MVVNQKSEASQRLHDQLVKRLSENITLYAQDVESNDQDVWQTLAGDKDDFIIYDRCCGRLTYHISLPYSILTSPYVEQAIRETYCKPVCGNCSLEVNTNQGERSAGEEDRLTPSEHGHGHTNNQGHVHVHGHAHGHSQGQGLGQRHDHAQGHIHRSHHNHHHDQLYPPVDHGQSQVVAGQMQGILLDLLSQIAQKDHEGKRP
uniref:Selenoprotein P N-terminal domain-containing protein n=1 Tax=Denticeps clupeoides TaxID=299321 RepID=A0AAY4AS09_9TELE